MHDEGVIKFSSVHRSRALGDGEAQVAVHLGAWRSIFTMTALVGQDSQRYGGAGFGNLSGRLNPPSLARGLRRFLITGTQTGDESVLSLAHFCVVNSYQLRANQVHSYGPVLPSSEALTHAAIYDLSPAIRFVFHVHSPTIWRHAKALRIPRSSDCVAYGTTDMAYEVQRLYRTTSLSERRVLAMGGHEDGIVAFGHSAQEAGSAVITALAAATALAGVC